MNVYYVTGDGEGEGASEGSGGVPEAGRTEAEIQLDVHRRGAHRGRDRGAQTSQSASRGSHGASLLIDSLQ